jgi:hypothetical protein
MGVGKYVLMSRSESDSGGRQRLSILADAFESIIGAIYLDQGFETARQFILTYLLRDSREIVADKRHTNYKSHLQEYVQSTYRTHPVYRIRSEVGPDHSKQFNVEVLVGRRVLGTGRGHNKKDAEQAAARDALSQAEGGSRSEPAPREPEPARPSREPEPRRSRETREPRESREPRDSRRDADESGGGEREGRRRRRGGRGRPEPEVDDAPAVARRDERPTEREREAPPPRRVLDPASIARIDVDSDEEGHPEGALEARRVDPYAWDEAPPPAPVVARGVGGRSVDRPRAWQPEVPEPDDHEDRDPPAPRGRTAPPQYEAADEPHVDEAPAYEPPAYDAPAGAARMEDVHADDAPPPAAPSGDAPRREPAAEPPPSPAFGRRRARR